MASAVQQYVLSPLPELSALKSNVFEEVQAGRDGLRGGGGSGSRDRDRDRGTLLAATIQTPTSSSDQNSERRDDPVALLSHPVEGFHHPRQHLFTDRLVGRFYEDTSLDAETRKSSKCLAGRLGTAGSNATTRPSTTAGGAGPLLRSRSSHPPTAARCGRRVLGSSASAHSQGILSKGGGGRLQGGGGVGTTLSDRKEQVQKEIMEQKALIEKLEGKMASLSSRGGLSSKSDGVVHAADARLTTAERNQEDEDERLQDDGRGPGTSHNPQCMGRASRGEGILVDSEYCSDAEVRDHAFARPST